MEASQEGLAVGLFVKDHMLETCTGNPCFGSMSHVRGLKKLWAGFARQEGAEPHRNYAVFSAARNQPLPHLLTFLVFAST